MSNAKIRIKFPNLFQHQREFLANLKKLNYANWGAQCGKTRVSMYAQSSYAIDFGGTDNIWIDRDAKFARDAFRMMGALYPKEIIKDKSKMDLRYELVNGSTHSFYSGLEPDAFRGKTRNSAVYNEWAFQKREGWTEVVAPRLRGWALFNSTPKGKRNHGFELWNEAGNNPDIWNRSHFPTTANPTIPQSTIETARRVMADAKFRQEILAEFVSDFGQFFVPSWQSWQGQFQKYSPSAKYAGGLDWAKYNDYTAWTILRIDVLPMRLVAFGRLPHMDYTAQIPILSKIFKSYGNPETLADASEEAANELMVQAGCKVQRFVFGAASKQHVMDNLRVSLEKTEILMPPSQKRVDELRQQQFVLGLPDVSGYTEEQKTAAIQLDDEIQYFEPYIRGGRLQFGARGVHNDDLLASLMMANESANRKMAGITGGIVHVSGGRGGRF